MCERTAAASNVTSKFADDGVDITRNYAQKTRKTTAISAVDENSTALNAGTYFLKFSSVI